MQQRPIEMTGITTATPTRPAFVRRHNFIRRSRPQLLLSNTMFSGHQCSASLLPVDLNRLRLLLQYGIITAGAQLLQNIYKQQFELNSQLTV